ncbi:hypothetical protein [Cysteiniphilum sp. QT6929]|uniref:hypothetical protein n=1 Tax=Cysteiniphilum sp. QT6929 TaxID=2975055 RepID=UPI0024B39048|nr:hypothetical protein [Cysteiniphilum sp. QT6929]WHN66315.1 hypothetical protein NYP54_03540 [Cysteiniphilum sp. QT6929]
MYLSFKQQKKKLLSLLGAGILLCQISQGETHQEWVNRAMLLQSEIGQNAPLNAQFQIGTHNSGISRYYVSDQEDGISKCGGSAAGTMACEDPNQVINLTDQLNQGARHIEFDLVQLFPDYPFRDKGHAMYECHFHIKSGTSGAEAQALLNKVVCRSGALKDGNGEHYTQKMAQEINQWLNEHPHSLVYVYLDIGQLGVVRKSSQATSDMNNFINMLTASLSGKVLSKDDLNNIGFHINHDGATSLPVSKLTANDVIGKLKRQVIIIAKYNALHGPSGGADERLNNPYIFSQVTDQNEVGIAGNVLSLPQDPGVSNFNDWQKKSEFNCQDLQSHLYPSDGAHNGLWGINGDATKASGGGSDVITMDNIKELSQCPINYFAMDKLAQNDPRVEAAIWSWAANYPQAVVDGVSNFAQIKVQNDNAAVNQMVNNHDVSEAGVLCRSNDLVKPQWRILNGLTIDSSASAQVISDQAKHLCQASGMLFGTPINPQQMHDVLNVTKSQNQGTVILLNYQYDASQQRWITQ